MAVLANRAAWRRWRDQRLSALRHLAGEHAWSILPLLDPASRFPVPQCPAGAAVGTELAVAGRRGLRAVLAASLLVSPRGPHGRLGVRFRDDVVLVLSLEVSRPVGSPHWSVTTGSRGDLAALSGPVPAFLAGLPPRSAGGRGLGPGEFLTATGDELLWSSLLNSPTDVVALVEQRLALLAEIAETLDEGLRA
ncbi:hypothetical protein [Kineococcus xinjiangensis]|uniref:hypothetical protein n=1 Tax=Kineococcus xinjiangensis TaxID=512762 RepID=UPI0011AFDD14|nr:hypothetical protein [Kineococcus xinjiangensis]